MRVLVATVVHTPLDARIHARQIAALRSTGHEVTHVAPWSATATPVASAGEGVVAVDVPRAAGRSRLAALRAARRLLAEHGPAHDVVLLHDPELLLAAAGLRGLDGRAVVWDVHEDTGAALVDKRWLPELLRPVAAAGVAALERWAERNVRLLLAEERYADRLPGLPGRPAHPVVPNTPLVPTVPPPGPDAPARVVQVGRLSVRRGVHELLEVGRRLAGEAELHLIGEPDADVASDVRAAHEAGHVVAHGFVPNEAALSMVEGCAAGLALLHDVPNYRQSMPTKLYEYLGRAVPVVTTPLPAAAALVADSGGGVVVDFGDVEAVVDAVRSFLADPPAARRRGESGHAHVLAHHAWNTDGPAFVEQLQAWAALDGA